MDLARLNKLAPKPANSHQRFGDTGLSYAVVDPVTLELSTVFHSQHTRLPPDWPIEENMLGGRLSISSHRNCQFAPFIAACRDWANEEASSPEEVVAVVYGYAMRLKYDDTDEPLARPLIRACVEYFEGGRDGSDLC